MAFGGSFGIGAPGDVQEFILWGLEVNAGGGVSAVDDDTTTAASKSLAALPGSPTNGGMNERLREYLNTQYGTSYTDIQPLIQRWLRDIKS